MLGGLHIEMVILKVILPHMHGPLHVSFYFVCMQVLGDWLEDSGWISALVQADIASTGTADSFIRASHVTKTRHAHQVTAASIHTVLHQAYAAYTSATDGDVLPLEQWCIMRVQQSVQFDYCMKVLSLELSLLLFVRAFREGNFQPYTEALTKIVP